MRDAVADMRSQLRELVPESAILSTCNRTEIHCATPEPPRAPAPQTTALHAA